MEDYEIERRLEAIRQEIRDAGYDLRRAVDDLENRIARKADKGHDHEPS